MAWRWGGGEQRASGAFLLPDATDRNPPGQRGIFRVGFDTSTDPTRAELLLETGGAPVPLVPAPS